MKILSINTHNPNFGQVRKSAAQIAITKAGGNMDQLEKIKCLVEEEKYNLKYDVIPSKDPDYNYEVVSADDADIYTDTRCNNFDVACTMACDLRKFDEIKRVTQEILADCKDD